MSVRPKLTSPGQFGLWGRETKRDWPLITQDEAALVLAAFDLPDIAPIEWHSARPFSAVSRLSDCDGKNWFLKRHHRFLRDESALAEEHDLIAHLAGQGLSVACPLKASSGKTSLSLGEWCYECFPALGGNDLYRDRLSWEPYLTRHHAQEAGYALACLHGKAKSWNAPSRSTRPLVSSVIPLLDRHGPETGLKDWIEDNPALRQSVEIQGNIDDILATLKPLFRNAAASLARAELQWGHGDWYGSNLIWQGPSGKETVSAVFDFSMADKTTRCFDIAVALERSMIDWMKPRHTLAHSPPFFRTEPEQIVAFLAGYERSHPLTMQEREDIAAFLPLAHITFACSEIWYYQALLNASELAKTTYETYLLGHAQWFGAAEGKSLLNRIVTPERADI